MKKFDMFFNYAGMIDLEQEPQNVYPEDEWGVQDDAVVDSYIEEQVFEN